MQDAAATNYDFAKNKAADIASAASDKAQEAKGETKVRICKQFHPCMHRGIH